ncbi:MAG: hypothetical protein JWR09_5874 [Mucilaginibacter sp.]|nr:hypothetical protein [Mucilaginibacter sp.]
MPRRWFWIFALLILACSIPTDLMSAGGITINRVDNIDDVFARIRQCWQPPKLPEGHPGMQITVLFMLTRTGQIFGKPKITFESPEATETESVLYRTAVMETLQRCTPMPFTDGMGGAAAGKPIRFRFDDRRNLPKPIEKRAWLTTTTL